MLRRIIFIFILISLTSAIALIFDLPYKLLPLFFRVRYGVSMEVSAIKGGFRNGIVLKGLKLSKGTNSVVCDEVFTDIRFLDLIFPQKGHRYSVKIDKPRLCVKNGLDGFIGIPFNLNTRIIVSDGELIVKENNAVKFEGAIYIGDNYIELDRIRILFDNLELELQGGINSNGQLNLYSHFINSENNFLVKGTLNNPQIYTHWGGLETSFQLYGFHYENGRIILPKISGNINIEGFPPIELEGGLCIAKDFIRFNNMNILRFAGIDGVINKNKTARIRFYMDNVEGAKLVSNIPQVLRFLIISHRINAHINIYGKTDNLQAGGMLELLSTPMKIMCRYRDKRFSFHSVGQEVFNISGSIDWRGTPIVNIKGIFTGIDIKELMELLGKEVDNKWRGVLSGDFEITGELETAIIESRLVIEDAEFGDIKFDVAYLKLSGTGLGPLNLGHSMVYYKGIPAELTGFIDPKEEDIFKNIEVCPTGDAFIWEGVNVKKGDKDSVIFEKDVDGNISIRFKSSSTSDSRESDGEMPEVELEYKLREDKDLLIKMQEDEGTVGVKHKVKF